MNKILQTIIEQKRAEVRALKEMKSELVNAKRSGAGRPFVKALDRLPELAVIAEVKKASPSKGVIKADFDPIEISSAYEEGGAAAISVLTDEKFFQGHTDSLVSVRGNVSIPVLRKDFIIDTLQVQHTALIDADAMLLIAAVLDDGQMKDLYQAAGELGIEALIEVHDAHELDRAMRLEPAVIGINNRNLDTFVTDVSLSIELARQVPRDVIVVSESGIENGKHAAALAIAGVRALLVGESLVRSADTRGLIRELRMAAS
jgi:indole-3-glycerol phosphate synthase